MSLLERYPIKSVPHTAQPISLDAAIKRVDSAAAQYAAVKHTDDQLAIAAAATALTDAKNLLRAASH